MKKEASKQPEKISLPQVMSKHAAYFSIELSKGFAHIKIENDGEMYVQWLNDEGYYQEDDNYTPLKDIERVADFMRAMKQLKLENYKLPTP